MKAQFGISSGKNATIGNITIPIRNNNFSVLLRNPSFPSVFSLLCFPFFGLKTRSVNKSSVNGITNASVATEEYLYPIDVNELRNIDSSKP
jgi:hypothetical protein